MTNNLSNAELRLRIAKLQGARLWFRPGAPTAPLVTTRPNKWIPESWKELPITKPLGNETYHDLPDWPTDARAALELLEETRLAGLFIRIDCSNLEGDWAYSVATTNGLFDSDDFCRGICLAFIAYKESQ